MRDIDRTPLRTYVYGAILIYLGLLILCGGVEFVLAQLSMGALLSPASAQQVESARASVVLVLAPAAKRISFIWPLLGATMLSWPLAAAGICALIGSFCIFFLCDFIQAIIRRMTGKSA